MRRQELATHVLVMAKFVLVSVFLCFACHNTTRAAPDAEDDFQQELPRETQIALGAKSDPGKLDLKTTPRYLEEKRQANSNLVTAMASSSSSAYTRLIEDIQNVLEGADPKGVRLVPLIGRGGGQNFRDILFTRGVDMGVTDADYMRFFLGKDPAIYGGLEQRVHYIAKLCNAEFHVLAKKDIRSLADLKGKKVNFWKPLSITALAAEKVFKILGVDVIPTFYDNDAALEKLRSGEISAMTRMSAAPHGDYNAVRAEEELHLLSLYDNALPQGKFEQLIASYVPAELSHAHYPKLIGANERILTVAGNIVLAVYAWPEQSERYQNLALFVNAFFANIDKLKDPARHPKWSEFNVEANVAGWTRFKPAQDWLNAHKSTPPRKLDGALSFSEFMVEYQKTAGRRALSAKEQKSMYQSFLKWIEVKSAGKN
jgi:uncharacterized protein